MLSQLKMAQLDLFKQDESVADLRATLSTGESIQAGSSTRFNASISLSNLCSIKTEFATDESFIQSMTFTYRGGTSKKVGNSSIPGRFETFELDVGENLLGCELDCGGEKVYGITWIKWKPTV